AEDAIRIKLVTGVITCALPISFSSCGMPSLPRNVYSSVCFFSSRRRHTRSVSAFLLNRSSDLIAYYVHPVNIQTACLIMEGAEFTENIINGVERPVKAAELFAFTLRVRAGNTDVLTDAEENVRQKLRAEGVM